MHRFLVSSFLLSATALGFAQSQPKWEHADHASSQIEAYRKHYNVPGLSIAIAKKGQIIFAKGFGFADLERGTRVRPTDFFRLASVSKPITATLVFELIEQGKVNLNAPARQYLPELPPHHTYLVRDLLCHRSGVRHYANDKTPKNYPTQVSALSIFAKDPLRFQPDEKSQYSTHAYTVLGALIEKVVGKPYRTYAADRMRVWGIKDVQCESGDNSKRTEIYTEGEGKVAKRDDISWKFAGGGYEATAIGMCSLGSAILAGKILKPESLQTMWTPQKHESMAFGWHVYDGAAYSVASHNGSQLGANSRWGLEIGGDVVITVLSNRAGHRPWLVLEFLEILAKWDGKGKLPTIELD